MGDEYYVYVATSNESPAYVGKGYKNRWKHALNGKSTCRELNRDFFEGKHLEVYLHSTHDTSEEGLIVEDCVIGHLLRKGCVLYNKQRKTYPIKDYQHVDQLTFLGCNCKGGFCVGHGTSQINSHLTGMSTEFERVLIRQYQRYLTSNENPNLDVDDIAGCIEEDLLAS